MVQNFAASNLNFPYRCFSFLLDSQPEMFAGRLPIYRKDPQLLRFYLMLSLRMILQYSRTVFPNLKKSSHTLLSSYSRKVKWEVARELSSWAVHHRTDGCRGICWPSLGYLHLTWVPSKILRLRCSEFPIDAMAFTPVIPTLPMTLQYNLNHWDDQALMEQRQGYWMSHASKML